MPSPPQMTLKEAQLAGVIAAMNEAVEALAPTDLTTKRLPSALAELSAAQKETDGAAMQILDATEVLMGLASQLGAPGEAVMTAAYDILQACTMNDIVGQRLAKAVAAVSETRDRLETLSKAVGITTPMTLETARDRRVQERMTCGPAIGWSGVSQSDVDGLFSA